MAQSQFIATGTADAGGDVTITFAPIAVNSEFTGVVSVPSSPATTVWSVAIDDTVVATNGGSTQYGNLQLNSSDVLALSGSGLVPGQQYQAVLVGSLVFGTAGPVLVTPTASAAFAAALAGIAGAGVAGVGEFGAVTILVASGAQGTIPAPSPYQYWSWGWVAVAINAVPTSGNATINFFNPATMLSLLDNLTFSEGASDRLAGANFPADEVIFTNNFNFEVEFFLNFSA
jgi:hypothetical protein